MPAAFVDAGRDWDDGLDLLATGNDSAPQPPPVPTALADEGDETDDD